MCGNGRGLIVVLLDFRGHRSNVRLDRIYDVSQVWGDQIQNISKVFLDKLDEYPISVFTYSTQLSFLVPYFQEMVAHISDEYKEKFLTDGVRSLDDGALWLHLECQIYKNLTSKQAYLRRGLLTLYRMYNDDWGLMPPNFIHVGFIPYPSVTPYVEIKLYDISEKFLKDYIRALLIIKGYPRKKTDKASEVWRVKNATHVPIVKAIKKGIDLNCLRKNGLDGFENNFELIEYLENTKKESKSGLAGIFYFHKLLEAHRPGLSPYKVIVIHGHKANVSHLYRFSKKMFEELKVYVDDFYIHIPLVSRQGETSKDYIATLSRNIIKFSESLSKKDADRIKHNGFYAFIEDNSLYLKFYDFSRTVYAVPSAKVVINLCNALYPDEKFDEKILFSYIYYFPTDFNGDNEFSKLDLKPIYELSERLYLEFRGYLDETISSIDHKSYSVRTLRHHVDQFKAILTKYKNRFTPEQVFLLKDNGISGFTKGKPSLQKQLNLFLQLDVNNNVLKRKTGYTYRSSLQWLLLEWNLSWSDAYPINTRKHDQHLKRLNIGDYYSISECREIAYHIESLLYDKSTSLSNKVLLYFAKIILKTGWNYTSLLKLKCEDIKEMSTPLNPKGSIAIFLQKPRAGYKTDSFNFLSNKSLSKGTIKSAAKDVLYVRDVLTKDCRDKLFTDDPVGGYVFIREIAGQVKQLNSHANKSIIPLLINAGCSISFSPSKVRKGGVNHVYRKLEKDINKYEATTKHTYNVFESNYFRFDESHSINSLNNATKVMAEYFTGKEISEEIKIVTDISDDWQFTPTGGGCSSTGSDNESKRYNKEHKKLHALDNKEHNYCAEFLGCVWCKFFRVIADPDHIWKLLSYKDYVLSEMEGSVVDFENNEDQINYIQILKERVDGILGKVKVDYPGIVEKAEKLLSNEGMHPDWEFAISASIGNFDRK
jgi:hypothetical protein